MKKTYNQPTCLVVQLRSRDSLLVTVSATNETTGLVGTSYRGTTSGYSITDADVKGTNDVNLWDNEW